MLAKTPRPVRKPMPNGRTTTSSRSTVVWEDTTIKGDIIAATDLQIDGNVDGYITCTSLVQNEASEIRGGISAETVRLAGTVHGSISARELIVLKSARIEGDVEYDALTVELGAQIAGQISARHAAPQKAVRPEKIEAQLHLASSSD